VTTTTEEDLMSSPAARKRLAARTAAYNTKVVRAKTELDRTAVLFDHWRSLLAEVPDETAAAMVDVIAKGLDNHVAHLNQIIDPEGDQR
jgi:hypothetical protein